MLAECCFDIYLTYKKTGDVVLLEKYNLNAARGQTYSFVILSEAKDLTR